MMEYNKKVIIVGSGGSGIYSKILRSCEEVGIHINEAHTMVKPEGHIKPIIIQKVYRDEPVTLSRAGSKYIPTKKRKG